MESLAHLNDIQKTGWELKLQLKIYITGADACSPGISGAL